MQFYQGQEVEVFDKLREGYLSGERWFKATIQTRKAAMVDGVLTNTNEYQVEFLDGTRNVFSADHIRPRK